VVVLPRRPPLRFGAARVAPLRVFAALFAGFLAAVFLVVFFLVGFFLGGAFGGFGGAA
jgi:hypothetical protein